MTVSLAGSACERREPQQVATERQLRVNAPPQGVRALPPHAIRSDGVGPYRLGVPLEQLGTQVPSGAQNAQVDIPRVAHLNVLHAEDDAILVGAAAPAGRATFVSVVRGDIARTASGIRVGSTRDELVRALGAPAADPDRARDPRIVVPEKMPALRALVADSGRVAGMVVAPPEPVAKAATGCARADSDAVNAVSVPPGTGAVSGDGAKAKRPAVKLAACLTGAPDVLVVRGTELSVHLRDNSRATPIAKVSNLVWAAPIRNADGRDDVVAVSRVDEEQTRTWVVHVYRIESGARVVKLVDAAPAYQLTSGNARWLGSELADLDVAVEVTSRSDSMEVGGLLIARRNDTLRNLVVLSLVSVPLRRGKVTGAEVGDTGSSGGHTTGAQTHPKVIAK